MNEDYLWDRSGPADPTIARLEQALRPLRGTAAATPRWLRDGAVAGVGTAVATTAVGREARRRRSPWLVAGAFAVAFAAAAAVLILPSTAVGPGPTAIAGRGGGRLERGAGAMSTSAGGIAGFGGAGGYGGS
jgi:hypothetical protein